MDAILIFAYNGSNIMQAILPTLITTMSSP